MVASDGAKFATGQTDEHEMLNTTSEGTGAGDGLATVVDPAPMLGNLKVSCRANANI